MDCTCSHCRARSTTRRQPEPRRTITGRRGEWTPWRTPSGRAIHNRANPDAVAHLNGRTYPDYTPRRAL